MTFAAVVVLGYLLGSCPWGYWLVRLIRHEDIRKVDRWTGRYRLATVAFPAEPVDPFFNANRPEDLVEAERWLAG